MTAQPTERDRATAAHIVANWSLHFGTDELDALLNMIETYLAAEREAALRPVLELAAELMDAYAVHSSALARELCHVADRIRAACSGQGDGADGPQPAQDGPAAPDRYGDTPETTERR